ncbi:(2Fe-2S)-binding protein [Nonomuraea soli]|uniref:Ferric siderophore reductase C-terminal domain-containing protein n=1 Tax=Nonomuraea soli TaxID=1032476 RepID=A0A7W0CQF5_9ACTN|nr:(2Fe-2S)-binding protein [Nonomuraea soli]MBA2895352.1 hypothetical protein [Nonomuraea soli]
MDIYRTLASYGERYRLQVVPEPGEGWIAADRLLDHRSPELAAVLDAERVASGQVSAHATALTVMAVYAGTVTAAALLSWALHGQWPDLRPGNVLVLPGEEHGFDGVAVRREEVESGGVDDLVEQIVHGHLEPLAAAMHLATKASLHQLRGGITHGCAAAFAAARAADAGQRERAHKTFIAACPPEYATLGELVRLREGDREGLFYLRESCCLFYTAEHGGLCASCCLTSRDERIAAYREVLRSRA